MLLDFIQQHLVSIIIGLNLSIGVLMFVTFLSAKRSKETDQKTFDRMKELMKKKDFYLTALLVFPLVTGLTVLTSNLFVQKQQRPRLVPFEF